MRYPLANSYNGVDAISKKARAARASDIFHSSSSTTSYPICILEYNVMDVHDSNITFWSIKIWSILNFYSAVAWPIESIRIPYWK